VFGKHHGLVVQDPTSLVLLGINMLPPKNISAIFIQANHMFGLSIKMGLAYVLGVSTPFACRVCLEKLPDVGARVPLSQAGIVAVNDLTVSVPVANAMTQAIRLDNGMLSPASLGGMFGVTAFV
jgi:hypothetical protein